MKNYAITVNLNEKKHGVEVRFNYDLNKATTQFKNATLTHYELVSKAFFNAETNRPNYKPSRMYYYAILDSEMYDRVAWLIDTLESLGYTVEYKKLSRSMSRPRRATK